MRSPWLFVFASLLLVPGLIPLSVATDWVDYTSVTLTPSTAYQNDNIPMTLSFFNANLSGAVVNVLWIRVHYCWDALGVYHYFKADDGNAVSIPYTGSQGEPFTQSITIGLQSAANQTTYACDWYAEVHGWATGDSSNGTVTYFSDEQYGPFPITILVTPAPVLGIDATPSMGLAPLNVSFSVTVSSDFAPFTFAWDFGDGGTSNLQNPNHTYQNLGSYSARVVVTDRTGHQANETVTVNATTATPVFGEPHLSSLLIVVGGSVVAVIAGRLRRKAARGALL